jgi:hypothetical protein
LIFLVENGGIFYVLNIEMPFQFAINQDQSITMYIHHFDSTDSNNITLNYWAGRKFDIDYLYLSFEEKEAYKSSYEKITKVGMFNFFRNVDNYIDMNKTMHFHFLLIDNEFYFGNQPTFVRLEPEIKNLAQVKNDRNPVKITRNENEQYRIIKE